MPEAKTKDSSSLRTPKPKKPLGLSVPPALRLPHEDLIVPEQSEVISTMPSQTSPPSQTTQTRHSEEIPLTAPATSTAPQRDYAKVANSITRQALPSGLFKGKSKQLYDALYALTRGALNPSRTVRISRPQLMKKADIGARITFDANITHLMAVGLIRVRQITGEHEGNEYEVMLPEETQSMPSQTTMTSLTSPAQKLVGLVRLETSHSRHTLNASNETTSGEPKTSFKTNTENDDDEAAPQLVRTVAKLIREVTGKEATRTELERFGEVIEVIMLEGQIAAARTTVSSAGPFLAEHLRRRLFKKDKQQLAVESAEVGLVPPPVDTKACPDCAGVGWYYPEGKEKGMAKCKHPRLQSGDMDSPGMT